MPEDEDSYSSARVLATCLRNNPWAFQQNLCNVISNQTEKKFLKIEKASN